MSVFLQNVVLTLRCSTFSSLMTSEAFERLGRPLWLNATAPVVNFVVLVISLVTLRAAFRWDAAGAPEAEQVFFREGEKVKEGRFGLSLCLSLSTLPEAYRCKRDFQSENRGQPKIAE